MMRILVLCYSPLHRDPRVLRQLKWLHADYQLTSAGYTNPNSYENRYIPLSNCYPSFVLKLIRAIKLFLGFYRWSYWNSIRKDQLRELSQHNFDLIIANDIDALPICYKISKSNGIPLIFDAHEYYPDFAQKRTLITWLQKNEIVHQCNKYLKHVKYFSVVAEGIGKLYKQNFGANTVTVRNSSAYTNFNPSQMDPQSIKLVHHGGSFPARKLEMMIDVMKYLSNTYSLHFYLVTPKELEWYEEKIINYAKTTNTNVHFHKPVKTAEITKEINKYDVGLFLLPPTNTNYKLALPNKFFEFIQARLAIAIGPSPEMAKLIKKHDLGIISDSFAPEDLAAKIEVMSANDINKFKYNCDSVAYELSESEDQIKFEDLVKKALSPHDL